MALNTSSSKLRSTILFKSVNEQEYYKRGITDIAELWGITPSEAVVKMVRDNLASTKMGRNYADTLYRFGDSCIVVYEGVFGTWAAVEPKKGDDLSIVKSFHQYVTRFRAFIDLSNERIFHLRSQWDSLSFYLERLADKQPDNMDLTLTAREARNLGDYFARESGLVQFDLHIAFLIANWSHFGRKSRTYRALMDMAHMSVIKNNCLSETAEDRRELLELIDAFAAIENEEEEVNK